MRDPAHHDTRGHADGRLFRRWHQQGTANHGAGTQAKGSPKGRSPSPGASDRAPKVATDDPAQVARPDRPKATARLRPADREGIGASFGNLPGLATLCPLLKPSPSSRAQQ